MQGKPWLSVVMLVAGVVLVIAGMASAADSNNRGGIFVAGSSGSNPPIDPQVSWSSTAWWLEYATAASRARASATSDSTTGAASSREPAAAEGSQLGRRPNRLRRRSRRVPRITVDATALAGHAGSAARAEEARVLGSAQLGKAKRLAAGHFRDNHVTIAYYGSGDVRESQAAVIRDDLIRLGFAPENVATQNYYGSICDPLSDPDCGPGTWDISTSMGWCSDYPDAERFLRLVVGKAPWRSGMFFWTLDSAKYRKKLAAANRLVGNACLQALGNLGVEIMRDAAPVVAMRAYNNLFVFSNRVDPRSLVYQPAYTDWSIPALALK